MAGKPKPVAKKAAAPRYYISPRSPRLAPQGADLEAPRALDLAGAEVLPPEHHNVSHRYRANIADILDIIMYRTNV